MDSSQIRVKLTFRIVEYCGIGCDVKHEWRDLSVPISEEILIKVDGCDVPVFPRLRRDSVADLPVDLISTLQAPWNFGELRKSPDLLLLSPLLLLRSRRGPRLPSFPRISCEVYRRQHARAPTQVLRVILPLRSTVQRYPKV